MAVVRAAGEVIGNYEILSELKRGGMGVLYAARHLTIGQRVVIKKLRPEHAAKEEVVQRFFQEAQAAAALDDPGVVRIFDRGELPDGSAYIVMEYLQGESLAERLKREQRLPAERVVTFLRQTARAVGKAHSRGIIHRDLKPDNLFIVTDDDVPGGERIKVLDFGIAKLLGENPALHTMADAPMGTPGYMSPEQWDGAGEVDARTDIYALGIIVFEMLTGLRPFRGPGLTRLIDQHRFSAAPLPSAIDAAFAPFDAVVARALAKQASDRFASLEEMIRALPGGRGLSQHDTSGAVDLSAVPGVSTVSAVSSPTARPPTQAPWSEPPSRVEQRLRPPTAIGAVTLQGSVSAQELEGHPRRRWFAMATGFSLAIGVGLAVILSQPASRDPQEPTAQLAPSPQVPVQTTKVPAAAPPANPSTAAASALPTAPSSPTATPTPAPVATIDRTIPPPRTEPRKPAPPPIPPRDPTPAPPNKLSKPELDKGLARIKPKVLDCGKRHPNLKGRVAIKFSVDGDGEVSFGNVLESPGRDLGLCVLVAVESASFPRAKQGGRYIYRIRF
jgi:eukaryotic-like serine/threonine-protein kinase